MDRFRLGPPVVWAVFFAAAMPWIRISWQGWAIYPGHWLLSVCLLLLLPRRRGAGRRPGPVPLKPLLALGAYICLMAGLRGQWVLLAVSGAALLLNYAWGWAAWRVGAARGGSGSLTDGLLLLLGVTLVLGAAGWAVAFFFPPLCVAIHCPPSPAVPYVFLGGWASHAQYLMYLMLSLPVAGTVLLMIHRGGGNLAGMALFSLLLAACAVGLLAGGRLWTLAFAALAVGGATWRLAPEARPGDQRLAKGIVLAVALAALLVYGLFPGYLGMAAYGVTGGAVLRVEYPLPPPARLSSDAETPIPLRLVNTGLVTLPGGGGRPARLVARLLMTPEQGRTRAFDAGQLLLPAPLAPGRGMDVAFSVRLPHWAREGYLAWRVDTGGWRQTRLSDDSQFGFRFVNRDYRNLRRERENFLTALARRARDFGRLTFAPEEKERDPDRVGNLIGRMLDTLVFSPLWGISHAGTEARFPFAAPAPFWGLMFQEYGAVGLLLGLWISVSLVRRANQIAAQSIRPAERLLWRLVPLIGVLLPLTGIFSPALGSFHGIWGLFLLSGFIEGRYARMFARRPVPAPPAKRRGWPGFSRRTRRFTPRMQGRRRT